MRHMAYTTIVGAGGYVGQETLDRVLAHPELELFAVGSDSLAGREATALDPRLNRNGGKRVPNFIPNADALAAGADLIFLCLGHEEAAALPVPRRGVVVDLSGGHRLRDAGAYAEWYGFTHPRPEELSDWSYGLPELSPPHGRLIANPGCYATAVVLALAPLVEAIDPESVVVDAKSGVSGAGREANQTTHFVSADENVKPYGVAGHRHSPEIDQELAALGAPVAATFTPHLLPLDQGELVSCYVTPSRQLTTGELAELYAAAYAGEQFVEVAERPPGVRDVRDTNICRLSVHADERTGKLLAFGAIDNLWKGAASQAVQNLNLMFGRPEGEGIS
jgi:N-acetyl-gamma-glutamyl-phosphate reductase